MSNFDELNPSPGREKPIKKAGLEMTLADHLAIGSSPEDVHRENPGKTFAETMDDDALKDFIMRELNNVRYSHKLALEGDPVERKIFKKQFELFLAPNIEYLRKIGRLPKELADLDLEKEFSLP